MIPVARLTRSEVDFALDRWGLSRGPKCERALALVEELSCELVTWGETDPRFVPKDNGWDDGVTSLFMGAGTVGAALSSKAEMGDPWLKALTVAVLGKGQDIFFRMAEKRAKGKLEAIGPFHTPGSAGGLALSANVFLGELLAVDSIGISVLLDGSLRPSFSWMGVVPLGVGGEKVSSLCGRCPYSLGCPLKRGLE